MLSRTINPIAGWGDRYWLIIGGVNVAHAFADERLLRIGHGPFFGAFKGVDTWTTDDGVHHFLDGFMMDRTFSVQKTGQSLSPERNGYGNFCYGSLAESKSKLTLFSDPGETRQIFYFCRDGVFIASNSVRLVAACLAQPAANERALYAYLRFGYLNTNSDTFFSDITQLKAGERLDVHIDDGQARVRASVFWMPELSERKPHQTDVVDEAQQSLTAFLKNGWNHYEAPMTTLTSGVDSNLFHSLLSSIGMDFMSLTHSFSHPDYDEFELLRAIRGIGPSNRRIMSFDDALTTLSDVLAIVGQPVNGLNAIGEGRIYKTARSCGADALVTGVGDYIWVPMDAAALERIKSAPKLAYSGDGTLLAPTDYISEGFHTAYGDDDAAFHDLGLQTDNWLKQHLIDEVFGKRTPHIVFSHAALSAAYGLQGIQPFLEKGALEFCFSLSNDALYFDGRPKAILLSILESFYGKPFPKSLKMNSPQREVIKTIYRESIEALIQESLLAADGYLDKRKLKALYMEYADSSNLGNSYFAWKFIVTEIWYRLFIKGVKTDLYAAYD